METLKIMPCPVNGGRHTLHDHRYIVTSNAEVEFSYQMPKDWALSTGSIVCEMMDCVDQKEYATLFAAAPGLLEWSQKLLEEMSLKGFGREGKPWPRSAYNLRVAISKATPGVGL